MLDVAEAALDTAHDHAATSRDAAALRLTLMSALLLAAILLSGAGMMAVTRRVIRPLHVLRDAMLKFAGGDLSVTVSFTDQKDEIGALAGALAVFRRQAADKGGDRAGPAAPEYAHGGAPAGGRGTYRQFQCASPQCPGCAERGFRADDSGVRRDGSHLHAQQ
jgi:HAMP domain-containing protein